MTSDHHPARARRAVIERDAEGHARDGTVLRADVYRPDAPGRYPTIVERTPYSKSGFVDRGRKLAERGYVFVIQDVRGRYASDGEFQPGFYSADHVDAEDGYDAVEWAAALPWSNGRVGTVGSSYDGWTQLELAHTRPPHLEAMVPQAIAANLLDREMSAVLRLGRVLWWSVVTLSPDQRRRKDARWGPRTIDRSEELWTERDRVKWLWHLPLMDIPDDAMFGIGPHWRSWLNDHASDHFGFEAKHSRIEVPALVTTGWYDQQVGAIKNFTGLAENAATRAAREHTRLIVGPWTHAGDQWDRKVGEVDFGPDAERDYYEVADRWFRAWLKDDESALEGWPRVELFVMGANRWRAEDDWPLARARYTSFYLRGNGAANTPAGDGALSQEAPGDEPPDTYVYDPRDPVMTLYTPPGQNEPQDQRRLDGRGDVLVYATPPLERGVEVTGPVSLRLWAASSAPDTDFTAKLIDVWPNGFAQELCYGIVRARYRESFEAPTPIEPGRPYEYTVTLNPTSNLFRQGHRIRVDVSSSDFPNFDRNHNTGGDDYANADLAPATQTIFHDSARPSRIILPVIPH